MSFTNALKSYLTGSGIPVIGLFANNSSTGAKITDIEKDIRLGVFSLPVLSFVESMDFLKQTNPELSEQARAAVAYFGMLAEMPAPTSGEAFYIDPQNALTKYRETGENIQNWLDIESTIKDEAPKGKSIFYGGPLKYAAAIAGLTKADATTAYYKNLERLQEWIAANGLNEGIKKTLAEQSRKLQGIRAGIAESKAAAARAMAISQITDEMSDEARFDAAEAQAKAKEEYENAIAKENELQKQLNNISKGLPADYQEAAGVFAGVPTWGIIAGGILLFWLGTRKGRKAAR